MFLKKILSQAIILIVCLILWSCSLTEEKIDTTRVSARLVRVVSGQTIEVMIPERDYKTERVRMIGIDAPPEDISSSDQAQTRLKELIANSSINLEIESSELDRYNRILAHVWYDDMLISEQLAKEGYVLANTKYPHKYSNRIFHAQEYARILGYGIWGSGVKSYE